MISYLRNRNEHDQAEAMRSLLEGTPGTQDVIEKIRHDVKSRRIARLLIERGVDEMDPKNPGTANRLGLVGGYGRSCRRVCVLFFGPRRSAGVFICVVMPLTLYWLTRHILD